MALAFSSEFYKIFKDIIFKEQLRWLLVQSELCMWKVILQLLSTFSKPVSIFFLCHIWKFCSFEKSPEVPGEQFTDYNIHEWLYRLLNNLIRVKIFAFFWKFNTNKLLILVHFAYSNSRLGMFYKLLDQISVTNLRNSAKLDRTRGPWYPLLTAITKVLLWEEGLVYGDPMFPNSI